ncbi:MAG: formyltetrahydrofolate deformylase [Saprospiraceae bacterium]
MKEKIRKNTAVLLIHCPDQTGIVAAVTDFLHRNNGNVISLDQYVDRNLNQFFMRVEWDLHDFQIPQPKIDEFFATLVGDRFQMKYELRFTNRKPRMAIFVSKSTHCLYDILQRYASGEWDIEIPVIISNHPNCGKIAAQFDIPYHVFKITAANKDEQEAAEIALLKENDVDFIVLARYMQIVTDNLINQFKNRVINIHHSFLPAFIGAKPYHQAYERGVKIIGATSHYVTAELDAGPIIAQDVVKITHRDTVKDLVRKGKNLEKFVLSEAIHQQIQHKILPFENRTFIFE